MQDDGMAHWTQGLCPQGAEASAANRESSLVFWSATQTPPTMGPADKIMGDDMQAEGADGMYVSAADSKFSFESASLPSHAVHGRPGEAVAATVLKWEQLLRDNPHDPMVQ